MATTTRHGKGAPLAPRSRRLHPLMYVIPILAAVVAIMIAANSWNSQTGSARPIAQLPTEDFHALVWSLSDPNTIFFGHHNGLLISQDQGATWRPAGLEGADAMSVVTSAQNPQRIYAAGHGVFYRSNNGGEAWENVASSIQGADIHGFAVSSDDADRVYANVVEQGILTSPDGGVTWQPLPSEAPAPVTALAAGTAQTLYVGSIRGTVYQSDDAGQSWQRTNIGMAGDVTSLVVDTQRSALYATAVMAGSNEGMLHRRAASNSAWEMSPLKGMGIPLALAVSPQDGTLLLANNSGALYRSRDGGKTWGVE